MRKIDISKEIDNVIVFIKEFLKNNGFNKIVVGLSGGIDSAVSAALAVRAVGKDNVFGFMLPYRTSSDASFNDAKLVAESLNISYKKIDISSMVDGYFHDYEEDADILRRGNAMARSRMIVLFDQSSKHNALVIGTGNKTELYVGYCTQYGDSACAFEPIGHLYKTEVKEMAKILGIPEPVITKKPTADLWEAQTDEEELGITYDLLDETIYQKFELKLSSEEMIENGITKEVQMKVQKLYDRSEFKRNMPPIPKERF